MSGLSTSCTPATFGTPTLFGAEILAVEASISTLSGPSPDFLRLSQPSIEVANATFCNVTVSYTHPGQDDYISVESWLPVEDWNGRLQAAGGGGWVAGRFEFSQAGMLGAVADGYVATSTDAGLGNLETQDAKGWALESPGNLNLYNLQNLASVSLGDMAVIAKDVINSFYGKPPDYSYFNGCSQGGRQGLMLAQRYPDAFDGIMAAAPALHWTRLLPSIHWPQLYMHLNDAFPYNCEIEAITAAAIEECDPLDGVTDGIITNSNECMSQFDPFAHVGKVVEGCKSVDPPRDVTISQTATDLFNATSYGLATADGKLIWHGPQPGTPLTELETSPGGPKAPGLAATDCLTTPGTCVGLPNQLGTQWLTLFMAKDPEYDWNGLTHEQWDAYLHDTNQQLRGFLNTDDADLSRFRDAGGKMVTFHGLADPTIPAKGTEDYYNAVSNLLPDVHDFYRYFEAPGMGHCFGGKSGQPVTLFDQLRDWVENGVAPEQIPITVTDLEGDVQDRMLCPYPERAAYDAECGDEEDVECWYCEER